MLGSLGLLLLHNLCGPCCQANNLWNFISAPVKTQLSHIECLSRLLESLRQPASLWSSMCKSGFSGTRRRTSKLCQMLFRENYCKTFWQTEGTIKNHGKILMCNFKGSWNQNLTISYSTISCSQKSLLSFGSRNWVPKVLQSTKWSSTQFQISWPTWRGLWLLDQALLLMP